VSIAAVSGIPALSCWRITSSVRCLGLVQSRGSGRWVWFNELEFWLKASSEYVAGRIREKDQRSRLAEWRNQLKLEKDDSKDTDWL
jgi:hypothetical protein